MNSNFLYNSNEFYTKSTNIDKYLTFADMYKNILFSLTKGRLTKNKFNSLSKNVNIKQIVNANKAQIIINAEQKKTAQNKAIANAKAKQNKAKANIKAAQIKKCTNSWAIYNKYKIENPYQFKLGIGRPNRPTCNEALRASKQPVSLNKKENNKNIIPRNRSNTANTASSNNLNNNNY